MSTVLHGARLLRKGVVEMLKDDATLMQQVKGVFRYIPHRAETQEQPFLVVGPLAMIDDSSLSGAGVTISLPVHVVWGRYTVPEEDEALVDLLDRIYTVLHDQVIELQDYTTTQLSFVEANEEPDADGLGFDGHITFQVRLSL